MGTHHRTRWGCTARPGATGWCPRGLVAPAGSALPKPPRSLGSSAATSSRMKMGRARLSRRCRRTWSTSSSSTTRRPSALPCIITFSERPPRLWPRNKPINPKAGARPGTSGADDTRCTFTLRTQKEVKILCTKTNNTQRSNRPREMSHCCTITTVRAIDDILAQKVRRPRSACHTSSFYVIHFTRPIKKRISSERRHVPS